MNAVHYAALVGKYIRMQRPATEAELAHCPDMPTIGMECTVLAVLDHPGGVVEVVADNGYGFGIAPCEPWSFIIWSNEDARKRVPLT